MEEQNDKLKLFADESDDMILLDESDELIELDSDGQEEKKEKQFGGKNILFICIILLLAASTIFFLMGGLDHRTDDTSESTEHSAASQESVISVPNEGDVSSSDSLIEVSDDISHSGDVSQEISTSETDFHGWIINHLGYTYLYYGIGVEQFNYSDATLGKYLTSIDSLAKQIPDGVSIYCMPVPTRIGFLYREISNEIKQEDNFYNSSQQVFLDTVEEKIGSEISFVNLYETFSDAYSDGNELFFKTDLNWTADAAYLAYKQFCLSSGNAAVALEAYEENRIEGFLGTFYTATDSELLKLNADTLRYYKNANTDACRVTLYNNGSVYRNYSLLSNSVSGASSAYSIYLGTTGQHFKIESSGALSKKLLIVGDGSAAAMLPFLISNYSEIHYIDVALYNEAFTSLFQETEYNDVLFMTYATNAVKGAYPEHLATMAGVQENG